MTVPDARPNEGEASYRQERWLGPDEMIAYADYWNDEAAEAKKPFWGILHDDFRGLEEHVRRTRHAHQLEVSLTAARDRLGLSLTGTGCDLAAGVLWAEPILLRLGTIDKLYCVEYSRQRLLDIGPRVLTHYGVPIDKIVLALGDIHHLAINDSSLDFVVMCASFHHSNSPETLLAEIRRVLRPHGLLVLVGEHDRELGPRHYVRQPLKWLVANGVPPALQQRLLGRVIIARHFLPSYDDLLAADEELGDHYYSRRQYEELFSSAGFSHICIPDKKSREQSFLLVRS